MRKRVFEIPPERELSRSRAVNRPQMTQIVRIDTDQIRGNLPHLRHLWSIHHPKATRLALLTTPHSSPAHSPEQTAEQVLLKTLITPDVGAMTERRVEDATSPIIIGPGDGEIFVRAMHRLLR